MLDVHGVKVADRPWVANTLDPGAVLAAARAAKKAGAQVVIASLHWGVEYRQEPIADQRRIAQQLLADPAVDLIVGHHAHVVQPFERIGGKWVAYGLGTSIARHDEPRGTTEEDAIARFHFARSGSGWTVDRAEYVPTVIDLGPPVRLRTASSPERGPARARKALARTDEVVFGRGAREAGLTRAGG